MSVGSICAKRRSYIRPPISLVIPSTNSLLPIPGGPHKNNGRFLSKQRRIAAFASNAVTVRFSVTAAILNPS